MKKTVDVFDYSNRICNAMKKGVLTYGQKLPTVQELADRLGVAKGTVKRAYDELEHNGVLEKIDTIDLTDKFDVTMDYDGRFTVFLGNTENLKYKIAMVMKVVEELYEDDSGVIDVRETSTAYVKLHNK